MSTATADKTYNGWTNYETWCIHLWISNDEGSWSYWRDAAAELRPDRDDSESDEDHEEAMHQAKRDLACRLKDEMETAAEENVTHGTVWLDLVNSALSEADWDEIAAAILEE